jgi:uncharacterized SAM-binding protein YcdF (DUF218 family)
VVTLAAGFKHLIPGSLPFLFGVTAVAASLLFGPPRVARWGRRLLVAVVLLYATLSLQGVSDLLIAGLRGSYTSLRTREDARNATAIVVVSDGAVRIDLEIGGLGVLNVQSAYNALEAARIHTLLEGARVLTSGGPPVGPRHVSEARALADALIGLGVPAGDIALEETSWNTETQVANSARWLKSEGISTFVLVTTPEHVRRAAGGFAALGMTPIVSLSGVDYGGPPFYLPTRYALQGSANALYEYLAWFYYWATGRI